MKCSRRSFLAGSMATGALLASPLGVWPRRAHAAQGTPKNLIIVFAEGGWDVTYGLDPRPQGGICDAPPGTIVEGPLTYIDAVGTDGALASYFEQHADVSAALRGVFVENQVAHPAMRRRILTGGESDFEPDMGAISAHVHGAELPAPYVVMGATAFTGPYAASTCRFGANNQLVSVLDPAAAYPAHPETLLGKPMALHDEADSAAIAAYLQARAERVEAQRGQFGSNQKRLADFVSSLDKRQAIRSMAGLVGEKGFSPSLADKLETARLLIAEGMSWAVTVDSGLWWDTHVNNNSIQANSYRVLFGALNSLVQSLKESPGRRSGSKMIDETVVVVISEMGRQAKLSLMGGLFNWDNAGKHHWSSTTALVIGAGVAANQTFGHTDEWLTGLPLNLETGEPDPAGEVVRAESLVASVLQLVGLDSQEWLPAIPRFAPIIAS